MTKTKTKTAKVPIQSCKFVLASDLFAGLTEDYWDAVSNSSNISFGDANRSLFTAQRIVDELSPAAGLFISPDFAELKKRINRLPKKLRTYVDLEN